MWSKPAGPGGAGRCVTAGVSIPPGCGGCGSCFISAEAERRDRQQPELQRESVNPAYAKLQPEPADKQGCGWASPAAAPGSSRARGNAWPRGDAQPHSDAQPRSDAQHGDEDARPRSDAQPHGDALSLTVTLSLRVMSDTQRRPGFCSTRRRELSGMGYGVRALHCPQCCGLRLVGRWMQP